MGRLTPKYPAGAEPPAKPKKPSWQQRQDARQKELQENAGLITEAQLRQAEADGAEVFRRADYVAVRTKIPGGYQLASYENLGNGRYRIPRS